MYTPPYYHLFYHVNMLICYFLYIRDLINPMSSGIVASDFRFRFLLQIFASDSCFRFSLQILASDLLQLQLHKKSQVISTKNEGVTAIFPNVLRNFRSRFSLQILASDCCFRFLPANFAIFLLILLFLLHLSYCLLSGIYF